MAGKSEMFTHTTIYWTNLYCKNRQIKAAHGTTLYKTLSMSCFGWLHVDYTVPGSSQEASQVTLVRLKPEKASILS